MSCGIYKITNLINQKLYIGQSIEIERRFKKHLNAKDNFAIHKAIRKYGKENFSFQILEECDKSLLDEKEIFWITKLNSLVPNGYNMISGGSNSSGLAKGKPVEQYSLKGEFIAEYPSANQASQATGIAHSDICKCCRGQALLIGGFQWKYKESDKIISAINKRTNYTVLQISKKDDIILAEYPSLAEASRATGIKVSGICLCCSGKYKTSGGYRWKYKD